MDSRRRAERNEASAPLRLQRLIKAAGEIKWEGEKLGAWRVDTGWGEQIGKEMRSSAKKKVSAFHPGSSKNSVSCTVCESVGGKVCKSWGCRIERNQNHTMGNLRFSNFLNLVVCASSEQDKTQAGAFKDLQGWLPWLAREWDTEHGCILVNGCGP